MNKLEKDTIYNEISSILSDFEEVDPGYMRPDDDVVYQMYEMLVKIQNCCDELVG